MVSTKTKPERKQTFEPHGTPDNDSDSATTEKTKPKTNNGNITAPEEKLLKLKFRNNDLVLFGSVKNGKEETIFSRSEVKQLFHSQPPYTKCRLF